MWIPVSSPPFQSHQCASHTLEEKQSDTLKKTELLFLRQELEIHTSCSQPLALDDVYGSLTLVEINEQGTGVLLVEQNATMALSIAHHGYIMETGKVVMDKAASELLADEDVREFYLGLGGEGEVKSFAEVKHYRRKKRWLS